jgi:hypothetical protein
MRPRGRTWRATTPTKERLTYLRRFKYKTLLFGEERVFGRLVYSRFFDTEIGEESTNGVDGLLAALEDKRLEVNLHPRRDNGAISINIVRTSTMRRRQPQLMRHRYLGHKRKKPKNKGPASNKGKAESKPDKPKPLLHPKAEVEHETHG